MDSPVLTVLHLFWIFVFIFYIFTYILVIFISLFSMQKMGGYLFIYLFIFKISYWFTLSFKYSCIYYHFTSMITICVSLSLLYLYMYKHSSMESFPIPTDNSCGRVLGQEFPTGEIYYSRGILSQIIWPRQPDHLWIPPIFILSISIQPTRCISTPSSIGTISSFQIGSEDWWLD
jgi:hypothetical protein